MNVLNNKTQEDICRACMRNLEGTIYINLEADMITMYTTCTDVKMHVGDGLPQHICKMCLASLNSFMQFRKQCQTSDTLLKQVYTYKEDKTKVVKDEDSGEQEFENNPIESLMDICKKVEWVSDEDNDENTFLTEIVAMDLDETYTPEYKIKKKKKGKKSSLLKSKSKDINSENNAKDEPDSDYDVNYESDQIFDPFLSDSEENVIATYITKKKKNVRKKSLYRKKSKKVGKGIEDYKCGLCKKNLSTYNKLTKHLETHKDDKACGLCHEASPDWPHLVAHRLNHIDKKVNKCYICDQRLMSVDGMELHIREKHFDGKGILCKICNKQFTSIRYLKKHLNYVHTEANFTCDKCSKTFKTKHNLTYHAQIHNKEKKHVCMECGFTCNFSGGLKAHIYRMHTSDDPQECKICKKPFKNKLSLYEHTRQHRAHCICSECGRTFSSQTLLQRHAMTHRDERPFKCKLCPAQYTSAQTLRDHNYKHEGIRPHQCEFCEASFYTKSVLVKHRRIHTGEKPYVCRVCQKGFTGRSNLKVHMKVHGELLINKKVDAGVECETN